VETLVATPAIYATGFFRIRNNQIKIGIKSLSFIRLSQNVDECMPALDKSYPQHLNIKVV
jgi:hypothetical protein